jgi:hypothetical protein
MLTSMEQFLVRSSEFALVVAIAAGWWIGGFKIGTFSFGLVAGRRHLARSSSHDAIRPLGVGIALAVVLTVTDARAQVLTPFRYQYQAQRHCPADTVVWLDFKKRRYYFSGQKLYGSGFHGSFVCLQEARRSLYRRSLLGLR